MIHAINLPVYQATAEESEVRVGTVSSEVPFDSTLEELLLEENLDELMLGENEDDALLSGLGIEDLSGHPINVASEMNTHLKLISGLKPGEESYRTAGMDRLEILQQTRPLAPEYLDVSEQRMDTKSVDAKELALQQTSFVKPLKNSLDDSTSTRPVQLKQMVIQPVTPLPEQMDLPEQMQALLHQHSRSGEVDLEQVESLEEQFLNAGLVKPGEQVKAAATRAPIESRVQISSEQTLASFETNHVLEPVSGLESGSARNASQTQHLTRAEVLQSAYQNAEAADLPFDVEHVMNRVRVMRGKDSQQITLRLQPDHLGQVTMKVRQNGGELQVEMRVDNPAAKQIIEAGFDTLRSRFLDQEFSFQELSLNVDVEQRSASQYDRDSQKYRFGEEYASTRRGEVEEDFFPQLRNPGTRGSNDYGLNIFV